MHVGKGFRYKPVATHRIENARLAKQHHENYGRETGKDRDCHRLRQPLIAGHVLRDRERDGCFTAMAAEVLHGRDAAEDVREEHIKNRADYQGTEDADRHVALRVSRLLRSRANGIKPDVGEKHNARRAEDAENSSVRVGDALRCDVRGRRWNERGVVRRVHKLPPDADHKQIRYLLSKRR